MHKSSSYSICKTSSPSRLSPVHWSLFLHSFDAKKRAAKHKIICEWTAGADTSHYALVLMWSTSWHVRGVDDWKKKNLKEDYCTTGYTVSSSSWHLFSLASVASWKLDFPSPVRETVTQKKRDEMERREKMQSYTDWGQPKEARN